MYAEFMIDEDPMGTAGSLRDDLVELLRQLHRMRQAVQEQKLTREQEARRQAAFLRDLLKVKERRCDQFVAAERAREASDGQSPVHVETEKWVHRLEAFQQSFDAELQKLGVTRYEPSGKAIPDRDDIKDTVAGTGLEPGTIVRILKPSYLLHGEMLRPAEVLTAE